MNNLATQNNNQQVVSIDQMLANNVNEIGRILPDHIKPDRFVKLCTSTLMLNPDLRECTQDSLYNAFLSCAKDGLVPDNREAAIVKYKTKNEGVKAQYQVMIDGLLKKVRQSGAVSNIAAKAVFENDHFDYYFDENGEHIQYKPCLTGDPGAFKLAFAYAKLSSNNELIVEVMPKKDIDRVRAASKTGNNQYGPWANWYDRMAVKSVLHRLGRRLPNSTEILEMIERDIQLEKFDNKAITHQEPEALPFWPDAKFQKKIDSGMLDLISSGKKSSDQIIAMLETKGQLTGEQINVIRSAENADS